MSRRDGSLTKNRIWEILERPAEGDTASRWFDALMVVLILISVSGVTLRTVSSVLADHRTLLRFIEFGSVSIFTVELLLRLWVADLAVGAREKPRLAYLRSAEGIVDLLAVIPFFVALVFPAWIPVMAGLLLLRIFKLVRYSPALATLVAVVRAERTTLLGAVTIMLVLLLFSSSVIYLVERDDQPDAFGSIPAAMWWGIATLTTVGYGDVTPITPVGKLFGAIVTLLGVGMFALPAGILSSGFSRELKQRRFLHTTKLVSSVPLFQGLNAQDVARVSRVLEPLIVQAGQVIVQQGEEARSMFFVAGGELEVEVEGHRRPMRAQFFGEIGLLDGGVRSATIRSKTRCELLALEHDHFEGLLSANPHIKEVVHRVAQAHRATDAHRRGRGPENRDDS